MHYSVSILVKRQILRKTQPQIQRNHRKRKLPPTDSSSGKEMPNHAKGFAAKYYIKKKFLAREYFQANTPSPDKQAVL